MNNINTIDKNNNPKPNSRKNLWYILMLAGLLNANSPTYAQTNNYNNTSTEQGIPNANTLNWIKLPTVYQNKLDDFLANNTVMKDNDAKNYTLNFVKMEIESNRWIRISTEYKTLFIRHVVYKQITGNDFYDGQDWNQELAETFSNKAVNIRIRACGQKYRNGIITYMNKLSADADRRSAEAQQRSAEAQQRSAEAIKEITKQDSIRLKESMIKFYNIYIISPNTIKKEDIDFAKESTKKVIADCKKRDIDYRAILLEVWLDAKKVDEILKFYGVE